MKSKSRETGFIKCLIQMLFGENEQRTKAWKIAIEWTIEYDGAVYVQSVTLALADGPDTHSSDPVHISSVLLVAVVRGITSFLVPGEVVHAKVDAFLAVFASNDPAFTIAIGVSGHRNGPAVASGGLERSRPAGVGDSLERVRGGIRRRRQSRWLRRWQQW